MSTPDSVTSPADTAGVVVEGEGTPAIAARIDRYLVRDKLGIGGMGVVLAAYDPELDRPVAIKLLRPERTGSRAQARLLREAQAMARLSHPNVVQVYDVGTEGDQVFLAMELVRGQTITQWLRETKRSWSEIVERFVAAGEGLAAAHAVGIVHRDFKPDNVLVADDGRVRVADFGIASYRGDVVDVDDADRDPKGFLKAPLTSTGAVVGTPQYMAPEQYAGIDVGPAADQFSFCAALHEALYEQLPFGGDSLAEMAANTIEGHYREPTQAGGVPRRVARAVRRGLSRDVGDRFADLPQLLQALRHPPGRRLRRWGSAVALVGFAGVVGWSTLSDAQAEPCAGAPAAIEAAWDGRRPAVHAQLFAEPSTRSAGAAALAQLDRFTSEWAQSFREVCEAGRTADVGLAESQARARCLERDLAAAKTLIAIASEAHVDVEGIAVAAAKLPAPSACTSDAGSDALPPEPEGQDLVVAVAAVRAGLVRAQVEHGAGRTAEAIDRLASLEETANNLGFEPLVPEVALTIGKLALDRTAHDEAARAFETASRRGVALGLDRLAAEAEVRAVFAAAMLGDADGAQDHAALASALVERVGQPPALRGLLVNNVAVGSALAGRQEEARAGFRRALDLVETAEGLDPIERSAVVQNLALATEDPSQRDELFARVDEVVSASLGNTHLKRLEPALARARHEPDAARARERFEAICPAFHQRSVAEAPLCHSCAYELADLHDRLGNASAASHWLEVATECIGAELDGPERSPWVVAIEHKTKAFASIVGGDPERALSDLAAAQEILQPQAALPWIAEDLADVALLRARAKLDLDDPTGVDELLAAAIAAYAQRSREILAQAPRRRREQAVQLRQRLSSMPNDSTQR